MWSSEKGETLFLLVKKTGIPERSLVEKLVLKGPVVGGRGSQEVVKHIRK